MIEALIIILALGGLEAYLWWRDSARQAEQVKYLKRIYQELSELNKKKDIELEELIEQPESGQGKIQ
jgi:hypothetical protein